jgi:hypothetical protein
MVAVEIDGILFLPPPILVNVHGKLKGISSPEKRSRDGKNTYVHSER